MSRWRVALSVAVVLYMVSSGWAASSFVALGSDGRDFPMVKVQLDRQGDDALPSIGRIEVYQDGMRLPPAALQSMDDPLRGPGKVLTFRSLSSFGDGSEHTLVIAREGEADDFALASFIEGGTWPSAPVRPAGRGGSRTALLLTIALVLGAAAVWGLPKLRRGQERRCPRCGELIEPHLDFCVICTNPEWLKHQESAAELLADTRPGPGRRRHLGLTPPPDPQVLRTRIIEHVPILRWRRAGREYRIPLVGRRSFHLGRDGRGELVCADEDFVRPIARIDFAHQQFSITDLGRNRTVVNDEQVHRAVLQFGSELVIDGVRIQFLLDMLREGD